MGIIKLLALAALAGSIGWFIAAPSYEPAIAILTSLSTFIGSWLVQKRRDRDSIQRQSVGSNAIGIQAGRDVAIGDINASQGREDHAE